MKAFTIKVIALILITLISISVQSQDFQGKAYYFSKSKMELGKWGAKLSAQQKKQIQERLKNRLEKTYILTFNREESIFKEDEKLDAMSGATDTWGKNFTPGSQYKNVKTNTLLQEQEFYGKKFLIKDKLQELEWVMGSETKKIGNYTCFKAVSVLPQSELNWWSFSWDKLRVKEKKTDSIAKEITINKPSNIDETIPLAQIEAWYSPQIPVSQGPLEYWGLPGLILEISVGDTTMLCSKVVINPKDKTNIEAPSKGEVVSKKEYQSIILNKMKEFRDNRGRRY
ncbi:GLPGLI family protein [Algibacter marinivivus]|uniref:GLPGLI family protein n=1 Tax=Algibacter marinivivus TaxID=2100723 RepID=A0A2U2X2X5_9FLAO|nr:GLPGLI family protein [Algibacter marinivivus]PWH82132.1 GLPGLI family protein [Algibacter marinivivus]